MLALPVFRDGPAFCLLFGDFLHDQGKIFLVVEIWGESTLSSKLPFEDTANFDCDCLFYIAVYTVYFFSTL